MRVHCLGGGPASLYFSILLKKAFPATEIRVIERNRADDTFGWGVVFSDETLDNFESADPESYAEITSRFRYWRNIETFVGGEKVVSTGHGFAALERKELLLILQRRCRELDVDLEFEREISSVAELTDADLVVAADGVNSVVRTELAQHLGPTLDWRRCKFTWLGTDKPLDAFTFIFKENEHGLFQVHAYPFAEGLATWIVECREEVWRRAGLDTASEEETVAYCERLFASDLDGHRLLTNRSLWRTFPTVRCERWVHDNVVLIGDAAHTAHFSIGSGTKMAMEDAMILSATFERLGLSDVRAALAAYQEERWVDILKYQKAAQTSLEWFENSARYLGQDSETFAFNLMTRSKRITYDDLRERDPALVARVSAAFAAREGGTQAPDGKARPPIFTPYQLGQLDLVNRVVVSPMCQYSATDGTVDDWHLVHLGSRAIGGAGLIITEMTDVTPEGRITPGCAGMYCDSHVAAWKRIVDYVHKHTPAKIGIQLAHAGRKASTEHSWEGEDTPLLPDHGGWQTVAPSAIPFRPDWPVPKAMDRADMDAVRDAFVAAVRRCEEAGFDLVELHLAHGYLLSSFISPLSNQRDDEYGGCLDNRLRFPLEVVRAARAAWPASKPLLARISASDWMPDSSGTTPQEAVEMARQLATAGCDLIDVSSGGNVPDSQIVYGRMYQVPFAEQIRYEAGVPVAAVGAILGSDHANTVLAAGRADLAVMARPHLRDPYLTLHAAEHYEQWDVWWPGQYQAGKPRPPKPQ